MDSEVKDVERKGTPDEIEAARLAYIAAKAAGEPRKVWGKLLFAYGRLRRRKKRPPQPKRLSDAEKEIARIAAEKLELEKGKVKLDAAIHKGKTELYVTDVLNFLRTDVIPGLHARMNRPTCTNCHFQRDHSEERWALQEGINLGNKILDIYARALPSRGSGPKPKLTVAEWPSEGAKS